VYCRWIVWWWICHGDLKRDRITFRQRKWLGPHNNIEHEPGLADASRG
jgi:hypothetical protein